MTAVEAKAQRTSPRSPGLDRIATFSDGLAMVVIETPKNTPNKLKFEPDLGAFVLSKVLPVGSVFPFDFGFLPGTLGDDGDPLDALVLMDAPVYPGCIVPSRLVGLLACEQRATPRSKPERNDRLIAVADAAKPYADVRRIQDISPSLLDAIEAFFIDYNRAAGHEFRVLRRSGSEAARRAVDRASGPTHDANDVHPRPTRPTNDHSSRRST
jgi:inorganic pyrophosphatase